MGKDSEQNIGKGGTEAHEATIRDGLLKLGVPEERLDQVAQTILEGRAVAIEGISPDGKNAEVKIGPKVEGTAEKLRRVRGALTSSTTGK